MRQQQPFRITLSAREVIAAGLPFRKWGRTLSDADVARDEISDLRPRGEPLVLRVNARGGTAKERRWVSGDWLCEADGSEPRLMHNPRWWYDAESKAWGKSRRWLDAWEGCADARWMLRAAADAGIDWRTIVLAACACARTSLHLAPAGDPRPLRSVELAEAWARGKAPQHEVLDAVQASDALAVELAGAGQDRQSAAVSATSGAAVAAASFTGPSFAHNVAHVAAASSYAMSFNEGDREISLVEQRRVLGELADVVRARIGTLTALRAAVDP